MTTTTSNDNNSNCCCLSSPPSDAVTCHGCPCSCSCWLFLGVVCEWSWVVAVIVGSGSRCGPWWSLWAMAAIQFVVVVVMGSCCHIVGSDWHWLFLGVVCEQSWAVAVFVGSSCHCGPWWLLWAVAAIQFGVIVVVGGCHRIIGSGWHWLFLGVVCEWTWAVVVLVGSGSHCGLWWSLWAMAAIQSQSKTTRVVPRYF